MRPRIKKGTPVRIPKVRPTRKAQDAKSKTVKMAEIALSDLITCCKQQNLKFNQ